MHLSKLRQASRHSRLARRLLRLIGPGSLLLAPATLPAATVTWDGDAGTGAWGTAANWSGDMVPGATDSVIFSGATPLSLALGSDRDVTSATFSSAAYILDGGTLAASSGISIDSGSLQVGNGTTTGALSGDVSISFGASLVFDRSDTLAFASVIAGSGTLTKSGSGTLSLSAASSFLGDITISTGTLSLAASGSLGDTVYTGDISIADGATFLSGSEYQEISGVISGAGRLRVEGDFSYLFLTGDNTYTGGTTIASNGVLILGNLTATGMITGDIQVDGVLVFNHSASRTYDGTLSGAGIVNQWGAQTLTLTASSYAPDLSFYVNSGVLEFAGGDSEYREINRVDNGSLLVSGGYVFASTVIVNSGSRSGGLLTISGGGALETESLIATSYDNLVNVPAGGSIPAYSYYQTHDAAVHVNGGTLIANGFTAATAGGQAEVTLTIDSGGLAYLGGLSSGTAHLTTTLNNGTLRFFGGGSTDTALVVASGGGTVNINQPESTFTFTGAVSGSGLLSKAGTGNLILTDASAFTGQLVIDAGTVTINGATEATAISSTTAMVSGRSVALYGTATAATAALSLAGSFSPGSGSTAGTFTAASASFASTATASFQLGGTTPGSGHDQLVTSGLTSFAGTLSVTLLDGYTPAAGSSYTLFSAGSYAGAFSALNLPAGFSWDLSRLASEGVLSVSAIPEPASCAALLGLGGLLHGITRRRRPSCR